MTTSSARRNGRHPRLAPAGPWSLVRGGASPNDHQVHASAIIRVFCMDGPCRGVQYLDEDGGRVIFGQGDEWHVYRIHDGETVTTDFGPCPSAYYVRTEAAG